MPAKVRDLSGNVKVLSTVVNPVKSRIPFSVCESSKNIYCPAFCEFNPPTCVMPASLYQLSCEPFQTSRPPVPMSVLPRISPPKVEVSVVVPVKYAPTTSPTTERVAYGEVVPMPSFIPFI